MTMTMEQTIPFSTKKAIFDAVKTIADQCDGAHTQDGVGFNGSDTAFGRRLSWVSPELWTDGMAWEAYEMLHKYSGQLEGFGVSYDALPIPDEQLFSDGRQDAKSLSRGLEQQKSQIIKFGKDFRGEDCFVIEFKYDALLVSEVRKLSGARWNKEAKFWSVPLTGAKGLVDFAEKHNFSFEGTASNKVDAIRGTDAWSDNVQVDAKQKRILSSINGRLVFDFDYDQHVINAIKGINGRSWDSKNKVWTVPVISTKEAITVARHFDFEIAEEVENHADEIVAKGDQLQSASEAKNADITVEGLGTNGLELRPFQKAGVAYATDVKRCFIADEMGLGKTVQALASLQHQKSYPALVVCPASLKTNWQREAKTWLPGKTVHIVDSKAGVKNADIVIINYDILAKQKEALLKVGFQSLVFDESHYAKNSGAQRTKALKDIAKSIPKSGMVLALTGTPVLNRPIELVSQLEIIDRIEDFGGSWNFRKRYCAASRSSFGWDFSGSSNLDELNDMLRRTCYVRRNKSEVLKELPDKGRYTIETSLSGKAFQQYRSAEGEYLTWLGHEGMGSTNAQHLSKITTLKKLAGEGKIEAACEWIDTFLDSTDRKLVVFAHHTSVVDEIAERYGKLRVAGKDSQEARQHAVDTFQNDPNARVIVLNMKAGGVGLTLTAASDVLFVEQGWTPAEHDQAEDRCHRIGQDNNVSAWYLLAEGTIDDDIYQLIEDKRVVVDAVTDGDTEDTSTSVLNDLINTLRERTQI